MTGFHHTYSFVLCKRYENKLLYRIHRKWTIKHYLVIIKQLCLTWRWLKWGTMLNVSKDQVVQASHLNVDVKLIKFNQWTWRINFYPVIGVLRLSTKEHYYTDDETITYLSNVEHWELCGIIWNGQYRLLHWGLTCGSSVA